MSKSLSTDFSRNHVHEAVPDSLKGISLDDKNKERISVIQNLNKALNAARTAQKDEISPCLEQHVSIEVFKILGISEKMLENPAAKNNILSEINEIVFKNNGQIEDLPGQVSLRSGNGNAKIRAVSDTEVACEKFNKVSSPSRSPFSMLEIKKFKIFSNGNLNIESMSATGLDVDRVNSKSWPIYVTKTDRSFDEYGIEYRSCETDFSSEIENNRGERTMLHDKIKFTELYDENAGKTAFQWKSRSLRNPDMVEYSRFERSKQSNQMELVAKGTAPNHPEYGIHELHIYGQLRPNTVEEEQFRGISYLQDDVLNRTKDEKMRQGLIKLFEEAKKRMQVK